MASKPRRPIEYEETSGRIFRPPDVVARELAGETNERPDNPPSERTALPPEAALGGRQIVRHSFDIYHDQLMELGHIQNERFRRDRRKPKMGTLVQEALDAYVASWRSADDRRAAVEAALDAYRSALFQAHADLDDGTIDTHEFDTRLLKAQRQAVDRIAVPPRVTKDA